MRRARLLVALALCGGAGGCGAVSDGALWEVWANQATVGARDDAGACWVSGCGPPTTYACVTIEGLRSCSTSQTATAPMWFERIATARAAALDAGMVVELRLGSGASTDRSICHTAVIAGAAVRSQGLLQPPCTTNATLTLGLQQSP